MRLDAADGSLDGVVDVEAARYFNWTSEGRRAFTELSSKVGGAALRRAYEDRYRAKRSRREAEWARVHDGGTMPRRDGGPLMLYMIWYDVVVMVFMLACTCLPRSDRTRAAAPAHTHTVGATHLACLADFSSWAAAVTTPATG